MITNYEEVDVDVVARRWWLLVLRGVAAVLFGALAIALPGISLVTLMLMWGAYAFADGVMGIAFAARAGRAGKRWGWLSFEGLAGIGAAISTAVWPGITALVLVTMIAVWSIVTGVAEIAAAIELRRAVRGEWMLALAGVISILFGGAILLFPGAGALALVRVIGAYSIAFGVIVAGLGFRVRRSAKRLQSFMAAHA